MALTLFAGPGEATWSNWNQAAWNNCLTGAVFPTLDTEMWCELAEMLDLPPFLKVAIIRNHATPNFAQLSPAHTTTTDQKLEAGKASERG